MNRRNGLGCYRQRKIIETLCADITATQAALLLKLNRNTINRYYLMFREVIFAFQEDQRDYFCSQARFTVVRRASRVWAAQDAV
jgi:transposase